MNYEFDFTFVSSIYWNQLECAWERIINGCLKGIQSSPSQQVWEKEYQWYSEEKKTYT